MGNKIVMGYWDCPFCGHKKIQGTIRDCPACGNPRGSETKFYMDSAEEVEYLSEDAAKNKGKGADWLCPYCDKLNPVSAASCLGCGALREESEKDYFSMKKEEPVKQEEVKAEQQDSPPPIPPQKKKKNSILKWLGIGAAILAVIFCMAAVFVPKDKTFHCTDVTWETVINIEACETVEESDWSLPPDGRLLEKKQEIRSYTDVLDHYEEVTKTRRVESGSHTEYTYEDNGDGTFTEVPHEVTDYTDETYTEQEPVYRKEPVYATKYYYEIDKWIPKRKIENSGHDHSPVWGEISLSGNEREGSRDSTYYVEGWYKEGKNKKLKVSKDIWERMEKDKSYHVKVDATGDILKIIE